MGKAKQTRKFATVKRMLNPNDIRLKENQVKQKKKEEKAKEESIKRLPQTPSSLFFQHNTALAPPYRVLIDTNFINFSLQNKLELVQGMMDCLYAKCIPCVTDCFTCFTARLLSFRLLFDLRYVLFSMKIVCADTPARLPRFCTRLARRIHSSQTCIHLEWWVHSRRRCFLGH
ncbi:hypothetical protein RSAG8_03345, partial [Rhizoctonia solani AG-8 WAC10335]